MPEKTEQGRLGLYLPPSVVKKLKRAALERDKPVNTMVSEALAFWWGTQPEAKTEGALFPSESAAPKDADSAPLATTVASTEKTAKPAGSVTKPGFTKESKPKTPAKKKS